MKKDNMENKISGPKEKGEGEKEEIEIIKKEEREKKEEEIEIIEEEKIDNPIPSPKENNLSLLQIPLTLAKGIIGFLNSIHKKYPYLSVVTLILLILAPPTSILTTTIVLILDLKNKKALKTVTFYDFFQSDQNLSDRITSIRISSCVENNKKYWKITSDFTKKDTEREEGINYEHKIQFTLDEIQQQKDKITNENLASKILDLKTENCAKFSSFKKSKKDEIEMEEIIWITNQKKPCDKFRLYKQYYRPKKSKQLNFRCLKKKKINYKNIKKRRNYKSIK